MNIVAWIMAVFSLLGALDRIFGNRFGLGKQFERGIMLLGTMGLSMVGMIVISPVIADLLQPFLAKLPIDASIVPASLFANDMGGAPLAVELAKDPKIGYFNALVVSSMMGCTISFTIPVALGIVDKKKHRELLLGLLCGIVTIPAGCFVGGLIEKIPVVQLISNLLPLMIFSGLIGFGLMKFPDVCIRIFSIFGKIIELIITVGLAVGIFKFLTGIELIKGIEAFEEGGAIILNASAVMTGAFPLIHIISKVLSTPMKALGRKLKINDISALGLISSLATSITTFDMIKDMDPKGAILNSAFMVSAAFTFAGHLAFTLAFNANYILSVTVSKLVAGLLSIFAALFIYNRLHKNQPEV